MSCALESESEVRTVEHEPVAGDALVRFGEELLEAATRLRHLATDDLRPLDELAEGRVGPVELAPDRVDGSDVREPDLVWLLHAFNLRRRDLADKSGWWRARLRRT